jgi:ankyrin repeat protein
MSSEDPTPVELFFGAAKTGDVERLFELSVPLATTDALSNTCLHYSCAHGHLDLVRAVVARDASFVNAANNNGDTALHRAAWKGKAEVVEFLLQEGAADYTRRNHEGKTAEDLASGHTAAFLQNWRMGMEQGADNNDDDPDED